MPRLNTYTAATSLNGDELIFMYDDPNGTAVNRTVTPDVIVDYVESDSDAVLNADTDASALGIVIDEDDMASDSATKVPTQQSVKAYVDTEVAAVTGSVDSVNGETGTVVLDPDDLDDTSTTHKFASAAELTKLGNIEALADVTDSDNVVAALEAATITEIDPVAADKILALDTSDGDNLVHFTVDDFATAAQGALADSAVQDADLGALAAEDNVTQKNYFVYHFDGTLETGSGLSPMPLMSDQTITGYRMKGVTAPTGQSAIFDLNINGTTAFTTQGNRPTVSASGTTSSTTLPDVTSLSAGDVLTVDIDQVGSSEAGANFVLVLETEESIS